MNARWLFIIFGLFLAIGGLIASVFAGSIERALVLPPKHTGIQQTATTTIIPTRGSTPTAMIPTPAVTAMNVLAQDTFQRPDQSLWGTASDGRSWEGDANAPKNTHIFSIAGSRGVIMHTQGTLNAILGPVSTNVEVTASGSVSHFGGTINFGVVLRWTDAKNWYKALINGTQFVLLKRVNGVTTQLGAQAFTAQGNTLYTVRLRAIGAVLFAKVWPSADMEPTGWMVNVTDTSLTTGQGGVRVLVQSDVIVHLAAFSESLAISQV